MNALWKWLKNKVVEDHKASPETSVGGETMFRLLPIDRRQPKIIFYKCYNKKLCNSPAFLTFCIHITECQMCNIREEQIRSRLMVVTFQYSLEFIICLGNVFLHSTVQTLDIKIFGLNHV